MSAKRHWISNDEDVLAELRNELRLLPNLPNIVYTHGEGVLAMGDLDPDTAQFIVCCHDEANECAHKAIVPASIIDENDPDAAERLRTHLSRIIAASYN